MDYRLMDEAFKPLTSSGSEPLTISADTCSAFNDFVHQLHGSFLQDSVFIVSAMCFGNYGMGFVLLGLGLWLGWTVFLWTAVCSVVTVSIVIFLKHYLGEVRPSPDRLGYRWYSVRKLENNGSLPSGDSAQAAVVMTMVYLVLTEASTSFDLTVAAGCALVVGWTMLSRVYFGCHWLLDTVVGAFIGWLVVMLVVSFCLPCVARQTMFPTHTEC